MTLWPCCCTGCQPAHGREGGFGQCCNGALLTAEWWRRSRPRRYGVEVAKHHVFKDLFLHVFKQWAGLRELRHLLVTQPDMGDGLCFLASLLAGRRSGRGTTHVGMCWCPLASTVPFTHSGLRPRSASRDAAVGTGWPSTCPLRTMWLALPGRSWATRNSTWSRGRLSRSLAATGASDERAGGQCTGGPAPRPPVAEAATSVGQGPTPSGR